MPNWKGLLKLTDHENEDCVPKWENERLRAAYAALEAELEGEKNVTANRELEVKRLRAENANLFDDRARCGQEVERLRADKRNLGIAYEQTIERLRHSRDSYEAENERLRAAVTTYCGLSAENERLRDKLSFAELYLANYKALYRSACVRARLYGDPTPLPERD